MGNRTRKRGGAGVSGARGIVSANPIRPAPPREIHPIAIAAPRGWFLLAMMIKAPFGTSEWF
uniref:Uncharacterized protein n=1 Tax=Setaria italica TaxID=4555 RepID=K3XQS9_SETIT